MNRRGFLLGAMGLVAAPAIVRLASIMPVKALPSMTEGGLTTGAGIRFVVESSIDGKTWLQAGPSLAAEEVARGAYEIALPDLVAFGTSMIRVRTCDDVLIASYIQA